MEYIKIQNLYQFVKFETTVAYSKGNSSQANINITLIRPLFLYLLIIFIQTALFDISWSRVCDHRLIKVPPSYFESILLFSSDTVFDASCSPIN